jgi:hypothetical protein
MTETKRGAAGDGSTPLIEDGFALAAKTMPSLDHRLSPPQAPRSGRLARDKGNRRERGLVRILQAAGFAAARVPLSGSAGGRFSGDITSPLLGRDLTIDVKPRHRFAHSVEALRKRTQRAK